LGKPFHLVEATTAPFEFFTNVHFDSRPAASSVGRINDRKT
jgi:hypothetical protein